MKLLRTLPLVIAMATLQSITVLALSIPIGRDINFPKGYDPEKAKAIRAVICDEQFKFVGGIVSEWPPDFGTRLSFEGEAASLNRFVAALRRIGGISIRFVLFHGRNDELRRDSSWQLDFSQAHPDLLTIYVNLNSPKMDLAKVKVPEWRPADE